MPAASWKPHVPGRGPLPAPGFGHAALLLGADAVVPQVRGPVEFPFLGIETVFHRTALPADVRLANVAHTVPRRRS